MTNQQRENREKVKSSKLKYEVSLSFLIPAIFSGISIFSFLIGMNVDISSNSVVWKYIWGAGVGIFGFLSGLIIFWVIMKPIKQFVKNAKKLPVFQDVDMENGNRDQAMQKSKDEISHYSHILNQATEILGKIEATKMFPNIIGHCRPMRGLFSQILKVAPTDASVLIMGETGTGKELIADSICNQSLRTEKPFVKINCAAIPDDLLENELFGHEKGAFTGANSKKKGKFELAHGGTIFLDEIGDISSALQAKLLRVLQEKSFSRLGSHKIKKIDVRFIFATNKNLSAMVEKGEFREDLFHRLNVFPLILPPLRKRDDISVLSYYFLNSLSSIVSKKLRISQDAMEYLESYSWPGNVRELENTIKRAAILTETGLIEVSHLPHAILENRGNDSSSLSDSAPQQSVHDLPGDVSIDEYLQNLEKKMIISSLIRSQGKQTAAAGLLNIKERSLWHRIKKYQINVAPLKKTP